MIQDKGLARMHLTWFYSIVLQPMFITNQNSLYLCMDQFKEEGIINHYGVSVERIEEGLKAMNFPRVEAIEIIFNTFRSRPTELYFKEAMKHQIAEVGLT